MKNVATEDIQEELMKRDVQFKMLVSDKNEIYVIYSNPLKETDSKTLDKKVYEVVNDRN